MHSCCSIELVKFHRLIRDGFIGGNRIVGRLRFAGLGVGRLLGFLGKTRDNRDHGCVEQLSGATDERIVADARIIGLQRAGRVGLLAQAAEVERHAQRTAGGAGKQRANRIGIGGEVLARAVVHEGNPHAIA